MSTRFEKHITSSKCLYCDNETTEDDRHFVSGCCGRGMCDDCYDQLVGTDEQIQIAYFDTESQDDEILAKCGWEDEDFICYECYSNWAWYAKKLNRKVVK